MSFLGFGLPPEVPSWGGMLSREGRQYMSIGSLIGGLEDKLDSHNRTAVDVTSGTLETRSSTHAPAALRQLVRNAVMHRSY